MPLSAGFTRADLKRQRMHRLLRNEHGKSGRGQIDFYTLSKLE